MAVAAGFETGFELDRLWHWLRGEMDQSKKPVLYLLAKVLSRMRVPYALIGGVAMQVHQREPRTTIDIALAVTDRALIPRRELEALGFVETGRFVHSENWLGPQSVPVQFTDDPLLHPAVRTAEVVFLDDESLWVARPVELLHAKLCAAVDPARRKSKRTQDLADAQALVEGHPLLQTEFTEAEKSLLDFLPE
jgi:hypothetical protein